MQLFLKARLRVEPGTSGLQINPGSGLSGKTSYHPMVPPASLTFQISDKSWLVKRSVQ